MQSIAHRQSHALDQDQATVTATQSLTAVKTLLKAGFGCITFLRGLLPDENFKEARLSSSGNPGSTLSYEPGDGAQDSEGQKNLSGVRVKVVKRNFSTEADQLLDYLEVGIFDALEKQYLKSFVFAVYLDIDDPQNVVEAYTFNFSYHRVPGTNISIPLFSIDEQMRDMKIGNQVGGPLVTAALNGKEPTLGDVKKSVKNLIRGLITATQGMDPLPRRRYARFKIFYIDSTPPEYEPPHFMAADPVRDRWNFGTHNKDEAPEKVSIGSLTTPFHSVSLDIASVVAIIPSLEDNTARFSGLSAPNAPGSTAARNEKLAHQRDLEAQATDALKRNVMWDADAQARPPSLDSLADAEGEIDPDYHPDEQPIGIRSEDGSIVQFESVTIHPDVPAANAVDQINDLTRQGENTQILSSLELCSLPQSSLPDELPPPSQRHPVDSEMDADKSTMQESVKSHNHIDTQEVMRIAAEQFASVRESSNAMDIDSSGQDASAGSEEIEVEKPRQVVEDQILDLETQQQPHVASFDDPIGSFDSAELDGSSYRQHEDAIMADHITPTKSTNKAKSRAVEPIEAVVFTIPRYTRATKAAQSQIQIQPQLQAQAQTQTQGRSGKKALNAVPESMETNNHFEDTECDCGSHNEEKEWCQCETCMRWYHVWCMGYHSIHDTRIPNVFECFSCQFRGDPNFSLLREEETESILGQFKDLALFRRAIKVIDTEAVPENVTAFKKRLGCEISVAGQILKRLEAEGFIASEGGANDDNLFDSESQASMSKRRTRKSLRPSKKLVVRTRKIRDAMDQYFQPGKAFEAKLLGLSDLRGLGKSGKESVAFPSSAEPPLAPAKETSIIPAASPSVTRESGMQGASGSGKSSVTVSLSNAPPATSATPVQTPPQDSLSHSNASDTQTQTQAKGKHLGNLDAASGLNDQLALKPKRKSTERDEPSEERQDSKRVKMSLGVNGVDLEEY